VKTGAVQWGNINLEKVQKVLDSWRDEKAKARMQNIFGGKDRTLF